MTNKRKTKTEIQQITVNDEVITNIETICNYFNELYSIIGKLLADQINYDFNDDISNTMYLCDVNEFEILKAMKALKLRKSPEHDII